MQIFISWSGAKSKAVAMLLRDWLPSVIQSLEQPWVSSADIASGDNWATSIGTKLTACRFGIICVTKENQERTWLNFEAGAISRLVSGAAPLLVDFEATSELTGPLSQLQVSMPTAEGMAKLIADINRATDNPAAELAIQRAFDRAYDEFNKALVAINADSQYAPQHATRRDLLKAKLMNS